MKILRYTALALLAVLLLGCSKTNLGPITQEQALLICNGHAPPMYPSPFACREFSVHSRYGAIDNWLFAQPQGFGPTVENSRPLFLYYARYGQIFVIGGHPRIDYTPRHYCYYFSANCDAWLPATPYVEGYSQIVNTYTGQLLGWSYLLDDVVGPRPQPTPMPYPENYAP